MQAARLLHIRLRFSRGPVRIQRQCLVGEEAVGVDVRAAQAHLVDGVRDLLR